jgi:hypothetical protein
MDFFFLCGLLEKLKQKKNKKSVYFLVETTLTYLIYAAGSLYFMVLAPHPSSSTEYKRHIRLFSPVFMFFKKQKSYRRDATLNNISQRNECAPKTSETHKLSDTHPPSGAHHI